MDPTTGHMFEWFQLIRHLILGDKWKLSAVNGMGWLFKGIEKEPNGSQHVKRTNIFLGSLQRNIPRKDQGDNLLKICMHGMWEKKRGKLYYDWSMRESHTLSRKYNGIYTHLDTTKLLFNSILSQKNAIFMNLDIENFYLGTPITDYKYMWIKINFVPQEIIDKYKSLWYVHNGWITLR